MLGTLLGGLRKEWDVRGHWEQQLTSQASGGPARERDETRLTPACLLFQQPGKTWNAKKLISRSQKGPYLKAPQLKRLSLKSDAELRGSWDSDMPFGQIIRFWWMLSLKKNDLSGQ